MSKAYEELIARTKDASLLGSTAGLLAWDQETYMPPGGVEHRSRQMAQIAGLAHERRTDPRIGELLGECEADTELTADEFSDSGANIREIRKGYDRSTKIPTALVTEMAQTRSISHHHWIDARQTSDFAKFEPWLAKMVELSRKVAECYGWAEGEEAWDALAEGYESGMRASNVEEVFTPLRDRLQALISDLMDGSKRPSADFTTVELPIDLQTTFVAEIANAMGFDFERGRIDIAVHPFCGGTCPNDVRLTTRYRDDGFADSLGATMHEAGHGLYEQGLPIAHDGTPLGDAVSLGIHESQSRMWENFVGRSEAFWQWCHPRVQAHFGAPVSNLSQRDMYEAMNQVEPSFIRVEADEATYNLHIMVRFELERALMAGDLDAKDLPHEWNRRYKEYLGVDVPNDRLGCLQDTHWSGGAFGYFPTYTLGNLYAAQLFEKIGEDIPDLYSQFSRGDFSRLKTWLNTNLHAHGGRYPAAELCERVTGKPLSADPLLRHLSSKLRPLYGV
ncbi:MAG: carboxypeptidase M32 [Actinomycetota bacterium]